MACQVCRIQTLTLFITRQATPAGCGESKGFAPAAGPSLCLLAGAGRLVLACWPAGWRRDSRNPEGGWTEHAHWVLEVPCRQLGGWTKHTTIGWCMWPATEHTTTILQTGWLQEGSHTGCRMKGCRMSWRMQGYMDATMVRIQRAGSKQFFIAVRPPKWGWQILCRLSEQDQIVLCGVVWVKLPLSRPLPPDG